jgi:aspartate dehydrogenase
MKHGEALHRIGLIGFGAIGRELHARLTRAGFFQITLLLREGASLQAARSQGIDAVSSLDALLATMPDLVVEAAGREAVGAYIPAVLERGVPVIIASTSAFTAEAMLVELTESAERGGTSLTIAAGAVGGLDYLAAVRNSEAQIRYTSRKPPQAWASELAALGHDAGTLSSEVALFEGTAAEAARLYPRNLNAGLTIAMAAGAGRTLVRVVADPLVSCNTHDIEVSSEAGTASMRFANRPSPENPKTSAIVALSLEAAVRRHFSSIVL